MDLDEYYSKVSSIISVAELEVTAGAERIRTGLNNEEDESPSHWVPVVQSELLESWRIHYPSEISTQLRNLYEQGAQMESKAVKGTILLKVSLVSIAIWVFIGWML